MKMHKRDFLALGAALILAAAPFQAAFAQSAQAKATVDSAKAAGVVGEQADGYLGFVKGGADAGVTAAVAEINAGRSQAYQNVASQNGVSPAAAGAAAFEQVVKSRLKPGEYYRAPGGGWTQK
jgi:uncharacterized protein YdbL (DUF1318 family)